MESKRNGDGSSSFFAMPLHYPKYTKKDYEQMPESQLNRLLADYGLPITEEDLGWKREFAIGAFVWPEVYDQKQEEPSKSSCITSDQPNNGKSKLLEFAFRVFGNA
ncbi:hypothetical protein K2173_012941 [Erythroxylum novogranatense]|uniref:DUF7722 domain-containing protein n=1 Tax=Erythroxylum novogranatense TaxID=1862640 RepID=A0AAV8S5M9_9ROSI|nr:hypothetical protein K2173_012941 [Erythroxylum novogranatense]